MFRINRVFRSGIITAIVLQGQSLAFVKFSNEKSGHITDKRLTRTAVDCIRMLESYTNQKNWKLVAQN